MVSTCLRLGVVVATSFCVAIGSVSSQPKPPSLDFEFFVRRVEPIFLDSRPSHTRCYVCHMESNNAFRLEKLAPGSRSWSNEQSRRNFETVSILVNPGDPATSRLLLHPLAPEAGGDVFHSGGRQFASKADPAWKALAAWVNGTKLGAPAK
jgi:hypothetical protein